MGKIDQIRRQLLKRIQGWYAEKTSEGSGQNTYLEINQIEIKRYKI